MDLASTTVFIYIWLSFLITSIGVGFAAYYVLSAPFRRIDCANLVVELNELAVATGSNPEDLFKQLGGLGVNRVPHARKFTRLNALMRSGQNFIESLRVFHSLLPGEVFVHRNVANVVVHTDLNCLSVIQFAVDVLKVKHIMVVGHYGCGGVRAALNRDRVGLVDLWLRHVQDVHTKHMSMVGELPPEMRHDRLCELNVVEQVINVCQTVVVQDAWARGQKLTVHGWVYGLKDGLMNDLGLTVSRPQDLVPRYAAALEALR
mgnify:CR=1 FL=1